MKISKISNFYSPVSAGLNCRKEAQLSFQTKSGAALYDVVCFSGKQVNFKGELKFPLKYFSNIPCPCCGIPMLSQNDTDKFSDLLCKSKGQALSGVLEKVIPYLRPVEKKFAQEAQILAPKNPDANLKSLINLLKPQKLISLENAQFKILNQIWDKSYSAPKETGSQIRWFLSKIKKVIQKRDENNPFKRKRFIDELSRISGCSKKIIKLAEQMPSSSNKEEAFYIKYSRRGIGEIVQRLLNPSLNTIEHILPASKKGPNHYSNFLLQCKRCNFERGNMPYSQWLQIMPQMPQNVTKYADYVEELIEKNPNTLRILNDDYLTRAARTLEEQSDGAIQMSGSRRLLSGHV